MQKSRWAQRLGPHNEKQRPSLNPCHHSSILDSRLSMPVLAMTVIYCYRIWVPTLGVLTLSLAITS